MDFLLQKFKYFIWTLTLFKTLKQNLNSNDYLKKIIIIIITLTLNNYLTPYFQKELLYPKIFYILVSLIFFINPKFKILYWPLLYNRLQE